MPQTPWPTLGLNDRHSEPRSPRAAQQIVANLLGSNAVPAKTHKRLQTHALWLFKPTLSMQRPCLASWLTLLLFKTATAQKHLSADLNQHQLRIGNKSRTQCRIINLLRRPKTHSCRHIFVDDNQHAARPKNSDAFIHQHGLPSSLKKPASASLQSA